MKKAGFRDTVKPSNERPSRVRHLVVLFLAFAASSAYLTRHGLAVANTTIQEELGFNNEQFGYLYSAFSLGYLLAQVPGGWLGQRFGTRGVLALLSLAWSGCTMITASVYGLGAMVASRLGFGLAQAGLVPNQAKVVSDWFPLHARGRISSIIGMSMSVGSALTMSLTAWLIARFDWRDVFRAYSLIGVAWSVAFYAFFRTRPAQHPWVNRQESQQIEGASSSLPRTEAAPSSKSVSFRGPSMWALSGQMIFRAAGYNLFVTFFPAFLEFAYGVKKSEAGMLTAWPLLAIVAGSLCGGITIDWLLRRTGSRFVSRCGVAMATLLLTAALTAGAAWTDSARHLTAVIACGAFFSGMSMACPWAAVIDIGGRNAAVAMGVINSAGCLSGIVVSPLVGRLVDHIKATHGNWDTVIYVHAVFYVIAAACWSLVRLDSRPGRTASPGA